MTYSEFYRHSIDDPASFWAEEAKRIDWHTPFTQVLDDSRPPFARWFVGGTTNLCHNAVDRWLPTQADKPALMLGMNALRLFDRVAIDFGRGSKRMNRRWSESIRRNQPRMFGP